MNDFLQQVRKALTDKSNKTFQQSSQRFFKEEIKCYGVKSADARKISAAFGKLLKDHKKKEVFAICADLWQSGYLEESIVACDWSYSMHKLFEPGDFKVFEKWISRYVNNWASCDTLCNHTVGAFLLKYPEFLPELKKWAKHKNRWLRRAASVSLIIPARKGEFLKEILEIAGLQLTDEDDLVQKGYGWMLKVAGQAHQREVFDFVMKHKASMPRTALRYAIEKMPASLKAKAMKK